MTGSDLRDTQQLCAPSRGPQRHPPAALCTVTHVLPFCPPDASKQLSLCVLCCPLQKCALQVGVPVDTSARLPQHTVSSKTA